MKVVHHLLWMLEPNPPGGTATLSPVLTVPSSVSSDVLPLENQKHKANKAHLMKREGFELRFRDCPLGREVFTESFTNEAQRDLGRGGTDSRRGGVFHMDISLDFRRQAYVL